MLLTLYLGRAGKKTSEILDGASVFANVWDADEGGPWFINNWNGFYNKVIGLNLNKNIKEKQLPLLKKLMSNSDYESFAEVLETNKVGMVPIEN